MEPMDAGKRKIASEGLSAAYVDVARSRQAFEVGNESDGMNFQQDAVRKFAGMRKKLEENHRPDFFDPKA
jgi:hypothetical protein